ncbi:MAG: DUF4065 domain-containing protein [Deltaproteobacteria bacterium]|nr:DUF4065 domain-containing protein [Deltaproteobacteria bacterium]
MASVYDAAAYILEQQGEMTAMKLQKLAYYSQAWSLVWDERPLFSEEFQAWANGPVCPDLYRTHRGQFTVSSCSPGDPSALDAAAQETLAAVLSYYGDKSAQWLSNLTHAEPPWRDMREGLAPGQRGNGTITQAAMAEYYGSLETQ